MSLLADKFLAAFYTLQSRLVEGMFDGIMAKNI